MNFMKKITGIAAVLILIISAIFVPSCKKAEKGPTRFSAYSFDCFDTVSTVTGYAESQEEFDEIANGILAELSEYHRLFNIYQRYDGMENLRTINALTNGEHSTINVDGKIIDLLLYAKEMYSLTGGQMNIAMGSVLSIWHEYRSDGVDDPENAELPPMERLVAASEHTNIDDLVIDVENRTVTLKDPQMTLDVGAVAKGYAVEMVARGLEERGISGFVINVGGNIRTVGSKPDGKNWTVGIEDPLGGDDYISYLSLSHEALVTSGSYQRFYIVNGKRYHHIIDQKTLMPAEGFASVSVLTSDSAQGDALSTALFCMSFEDGMSLIESLTGVEAQWVFGDGTLKASSGWASHTVLP